MTTCRLSDQSNPGWSKRREISIEYLGIVLFVALAWGNALRLML